MGSSKKNSLQSMKMTRRTAMRTAGTAGAALAAGGGGGLTPAVAAQSTPSPAAASYPVLVEQPPVTIYDYGLDLPTDDVTFRWADHQGVRVPFHEAVHAAFEEAHPNITVEYDSLGADLAELLTVGLRGGSGHDVFPTLAGITSAQAVREGWAAPLDDIVPDFEQWKAAFPPDTFLPGMSVFDGKTYYFPIYSPKLSRELLYFNTELLEKAGYDPTTALTWEEFRAAAKTVTEQGNGEQFGMIQAGGPGSTFVDTIAEIAGANGGEFNWLTGDYNYTSDEYLAAIDLMLAMKDDGSFLPGMVSLTGTDMRSIFPQGRAAMVISGIWNVSIWEEAAPDFQFGVASSPVPDSGEPWPITKVPGGDNGYFINADSDYKEIAGALFAFVGSLEGQIALKEISKAVNPVVFPEANEIVEHSPTGERALELNYEQIRLQPEPVVRNIDVTQVNMETRPVTPNLDEVLLGLFTEQLDNPRQVMQDLKDRSNAELDRAIEAARAEGAEVTRDDWVFPNWNPREDYTLEDYEEL